MFTFLSNSGLSQFASQTPKHHNFYQVFSSFFALTLAMVNIWSRLFRVAKQLPFAPSVNQT